MKAGGIIALLAVTALVCPGGEWTAATLAGTGSPSGTKDAINDPYGLVRGPDGAIWFCEHNGHRISRLAPDGTLSVIAGTGTKGDGPEGNATRCALNRPHGVFVDADGSVLIGDSEAHRLRVLRPE